MLLLEIDFLSFSLGLLRRIIIKSTSLNYFSICSGTKVGRLDREPDCLGSSFTSHIFGEQLQYASSEQDIRSLYKQEKKLIQ